SWRSSRSVMRGSVIGTARYRTANSRPPADARQLVPPAATVGCGAPSVVVMNHQRPAQGLPPPGAARSGRLEAPDQHRPDPLGDGVGGPPIATGNAEERKDERDDRVDERHHRLELEHEPVVEPAVGEPAGDFLLLDADHDRPLAGETLDH